MSDREQHGGEDDDVSEDPKSRRSAPSYLEVMLGQLFVVVLGLEGTAMEVMKAHRKNYYGGVFLTKAHLDSPEKARRVTHRFRRHTRDIPIPLVAIDEEGGMVTNIGHLTTPAPSAAVLGAVDDVEVTRDVYLGIGEKLRALGVNATFAPVLDVNVEELNPVIGTRAFGKSADLVARHGEAALQGLKDAKVASCAKHFPGHGATSLDSHKVLPTVDANADVLARREMEPFRRVLESETPPDMVMTAHVAYPALDRSGAPATVSRPILSTLRREMGFGGVIVTDSMEMRGIADGLGPERAAVEAIQAGVDLLLYAQDAEMAQAAYDGLKKAVQSGKISQERILQSVDRVFKMRRHLQNQEWIRDEEAQEILEARHEQAFFEAAMNGLVLEGNAGVLAEIPENRGLKVIVLPRRLDEYRPLPLGVVKEQLEPVGFRLVEVDPRPTDEEIGLAERAVAEASVVVVGVASRGKMAEESKRLVEAVTRRDVVKVGVALLDPADADQMMTANCRIKTFGFAPPQLWAMCQRFLG